MHLYCDRGTDGCFHKEIEMGTLRIYEVGAEVESSANIEWWISRP